MQSRLYKLSLVAFAGAAFFAAPVFAYTSPGTPTGYVNDFAHVLSTDAVQQLNESLAQFEASTSNEIAVVTVQNMSGDYVEHYASELFKDWGIGKQHTDNGVLLLVAIDEHKIRIEVGYGLEGALPDSIAASIIKKDLTPNLAAGKFDTAIQTAVDDIALATKGEYVGASTAPTNSSWLTLENILTLLFIPIFLLQWLASVLSRSKSWWAGGVLGTVIGLGIGSFAGLGLLTFVGVTGALALLGALFDFAVSHGYNQAKHLGTTPPWWTGGTFGSGSGSSGGGFGGFGGGSSGGGGASGGW